MGELFEELCKGPVVVIDDMIGKDEDRINELIKEIQKHNLPILKFKSIEEVRQELPGLCFSNFIVLDWKMIGGVEGMPEVQLGSTAEEMAEQEVMELIKEFQKICLAPIFVVSAYNKGDIIAKLKGAGIVKEGKNFVFVENKDELCGTEGALISKIEDWINDNPHIYLAKCWTNEWLSKNTLVFWDLYELNPDWPTLFYHSFKERGEDPILALRDTLIQLVYSEIDVTPINESLLDKETKEVESNSSESLKELYQRLVYTTSNIERDIRPGDIFKRKENGKDRYYLNIRPECDTTKRNESDDPELYLLKGDAKKPAEIKKRYQGKYGIIPWENEIIMLHLDGKDIVRFDKKKLFVKKFSEIKECEKICRIVPPFITQIRQSISSYLGRFGVPSYPPQIVDSLFESNGSSSEA
jgi:hypothetical protein